MLGRIDMDGKSSFSLNQARRAIEEGREVMLVSLEMSNREIVDRFSSSIFKDFKVTKNRYPFPPTSSTLQ
jgi:replicative DNA helicase